jgi:hypothetical protein
MKTAERTEPLLRTLAPALAQLRRRLRQWLDGPHRYPLPTMTRAALEGIATDLGRQAEALDVERPILVIVLMGGTGVGKSTLLNALAGGAVAQASLARPTTRDPVVYYHESIKPDRLDPALRQCVLAPHDRPELEYKVLVDTPDLDSNDLSNRDKLRQVLPVADVVLYVGSQEKYHDKLGWDLFLRQRRRRAFAFILNKWDRCLHAAANGLTPDEDLLRDLRSEGFDNPLLFRTCARLWTDSAGQGMDPDAQGAANGVPAGEQFPELVRWLEMGLTRLEVEAIKARGVSQLLDHLQTVLAEIRPPELAEPAARTKVAWQKLIDTEAAASAEILINTLEPYQREIEHHFALEAQRRFRGLMATYLNLFSRARYVGSTLRDRIPLVPRLGQRADTPAAWNLVEFTAACTKVAGEQHLEARNRALTNRLLVEAGVQGFPVALLSEPTEAAARVNWQQRFAQILIDVLAEVEQYWSRPTGWRHWRQATIIWLANYLPVCSLLAVLFGLLWRYTMGRAWPQLGDALLPVMVVLIVLVLLHILISLVLPMRWPAMKSEFQRRLDQALDQELTKTYAAIPESIAAHLEDERHQVEKLGIETKDVATWLEKREQAARIDSLYGSNQRPAASGTGPPSGGAAP